MHETTPTEHLVTETTKTVGGILIALDLLREDVEKINIEVLASNNEDSLVAVHKALNVLQTNLERARLATLIASFLSGGQHG